jgi:hypothetical protein
MPRLLKSNLSIRNTLGRDADQHFFAAQQGIDRELRKLSHGHTPFSLTQDREDLRLSVSACLHSEFPHASCRENSTYAAPYFRGGIPIHQFRVVYNRGSLLSTAALGSRIRKRHLLPKALVQ